MLLNKVLRSDTQLLLRVVSYRPNLSTDSTDSFRANKITSAASVRSLVVIIIIFFDPGTQFPRNEKITLCNTISWWRGSVVERRSLAGELSLSCARPAADG